MSELPNKPHLLPREVQAFLGLSRSKLYDMLKNGEIPAKRLGDIYRIPRKEFLEWYDSLTVKSPARAASSF